MARHRGNKIEALLNERDKWVYEDQDILNFLVTHFHSLFSSTNPLLYNLQTRSSFPSISTEDMLSLGAPIALEEVRNALFSIGNYKAPGPDRLHPLFFKAKWDVVGPSIFQFVNQVFEDPTKIGDINQTLLTLVPKIPEPLIFGLSPFVT